MSTPKINPRAAKRIAAGLRRMAQDFDELFGDTPRKAIRRHPIRETTEENLAAGEAALRRRGLG